MQAAHLPALEALYVSYNKLGSLSGAMAETTVPYIDLSHNGIKSVSAFVKWSIQRAIQSDVLVKEWGWS